jgi:hypothetical protein
MTHSLASVPWPLVLFKTDGRAKLGYGGYISHYDLDDDDGHFDGVIWGMFAAALAGNWPDAPTM